MRKITIGLLITLMAAGFMFTGCPSDAGEDPITVTGTATRTIPSVGTAGVEVTLTLAALTPDYQITAVAIQKSSEDTGGFVPTYINTDAVKNKVIEQNSVEIDKVTGATYSWKAFVEAGINALNQIDGVDLVLADKYK
ncbi:MAG: FMN-binding protein [Treponema sp.]|jgi:hypothetical protein|nr:FMN-binding protein [Treponema sp.]